MDVPFVCHPPGVVNEFDLLGLEDVYVPALSTADPQKHSTYEATSDGLDENQSTNISFVHTFPVPCAKDGAFGAVTVLASYGALIENVPSVITPENASVFKICPVSPFVVQLLTDNRS